MAHHDWPDDFMDDSGHGPVWHAVMSLLTIAGIGAVLLLAGVALAAPR